MKPDPANHPIILFDGVCNLCNGWVDYVIRRDRAHVFHFASLQGESAAQLAPAYGGEQNLSTIVLIDADGIHVRSSAVLRVLRRLGGFLAILAGIGMIIPPPLRDALYRWVASNRYQWFGKKDSCRLPTPAERTLFLN